METQLNILRARRHVLRVEVARESRPPPHDAAAAAVHDPFACESYGFFLPRSAVDADQNAERVLAAPDSQSAPDENHPAVAQGRVEKPAKRTAKRTVANWTPEMDKVVKKGLEKHGWGAWSRIAASGKLPKEYTPKMISNRATSIGLTKDKFDAPRSSAPVSKAKT